MRTALVLLALLCPAAAGAAHIGSPDVYFEGDAGPYHLLVTIRPPAVIPGVAQVQVRSLSPGVRKITILPVTMQGPGADLAPRPDVAQPDSSDPQLFNGNLWIMLRGSWKVKIVAEGPQGERELSVPVAAVSTTSAQMQKGLGVLLAALGLLLVAGLASIIRASNGEAKLAPKEKLTPPLSRRANRVMGFAVLLIAALLFLGNVWWGAEAKANANMVYHVPHVASSLQPDGRLLLHLDNPNAGSGETFDNSWAQAIRMDDLIPDHGHLMHLFLVRMPDMKSFWHLHPEHTDNGGFAANLPALPAGTYQIYADIVHGTGFPETQIGTIDLPQASGQPLAGDDSGGPQLEPSSGAAPLSDGYRMVWKRDQTLHAKQPILFRFRLEDKDGKPADGMENYMGMAGHAVFLSDDGKVFAHVHPEGSVSMAALAIAQGQGAASAGSDSMGDMSMMNHAPASAEVSFPYGFPQPGNYHLFIQVKRAGHVETGVFTAHVEN